MKKKWIVLAGVVLALGALVATAAAHRGGKMRGHGPRALMEQLDLSDEQQEQLVELRSEHREQMKEARGDGAEAFKALREEHRAAVSKILNEVQREKMEALHEEFAGGFYGMRGHRGKWGHGMRGRGHGGKNGFARLDLSDEQQEQLKGLHKAHREVVGKLRQGHREAMEKLLTDEQRAQLEELKDEAFYGGKRRMRRHMW